MSRRLDSRQTTRITLLLAPLLFVGCVFSPDREPPVPPRPIDSEAALIQTLADAYQQRSYAKFSTLLSTEPGAEYLFILQPDPNSEPNWGHIEELRIHQRMFEPQNTPPGDPPVPTELWLSSISITLSPQTDFTERPDLYQSTSNPDGLPASRWKATEATYQTNVFFELQGETDYQVTGRASFVVITDLTKNIGDPGKFLIYRWEDLDPPPPSKPGASPAA